MNIRATAALLIITLLSGCAANTARRDAILREVRAANAPSDVIGKMQSSRPLAFDDLSALRKSNVPEKVIADYIDLTRTQYILTVEMVNRLTREGFTPGFVDFLLTTPALYPQVVRIYDPYPVYYPIYVPVRRR